jgi:hypothetical protein
MEATRSGPDWHVESDLPAVATAGAPLDFRIVVTSRAALPAGARFALAWRWPADWERPQGEDARAPAHLGVTAGQGGAVPWKPARIEEWHPFDHALIATLPAPLRAGETVAFTARALGAQTFIEERSPMAVRVDRDGTGAWEEIARLHLRIEGGPAHRLVATAPSDVVAGEEVLVHLRLEDVWGNPARMPPTAVSIEGTTATIDAEHGAVVRVPVRLSSPGVHRLAARTADGLQAVTNPIRRHATPPPERRYWGDIHAQSSIGCGARSIADYFGHARDFAAADFASHQANCFMVSREEWTETQEVTRALNEPGRYVTLLGVEWSGETAVGGDHNLYFPGDAATLRRCSHRLVPDLSDADTDLPHIADVHRHYAGEDVLIAIHVGGRTSNLAWHEPVLERLVEVHSTHATSEWMAVEAMRRGWRFGITGGSDGVDGRPAASHPGRQRVRNLRGGLTAVALPALTRPALWSALRAMRTYATNGPRILLDVTPAGAGRFQVEVEGTAPLAAVTLLRGAAEVAHAPRAATLSDTWRLRWWGAAARGNWSQTRVVWNGSARLRGATLREARPWRWDTPAEGIVTVASDRVAWASITAGSWDGVLLRIADAAPGATLLVETQPLTAELPLDKAFVSVDGTGDPAPRLVLERLPREPAPLGWSGILADNAAPDGMPHWIRVEQEDGGIAWSSPIWPAS